MAGRDLQICRLGCGYGKLRVLSVDLLFLRKGENSLLLGHNGSGKSTFLKTLSGVIRPVSGEIPKEITTILLPEEVDFPSGLSAGSIYATLCPKEDRRRDVLDLLEIPSKKFFFQLSKGNRQKFRVAVAESLGRSLDKSVLCLDEPLSGLDVIARRKIIEAWNGCGGLGEIWGGYHGHRLISQHSGVAPSATQTLVVQGGRLTSYPPLSTCDNWPEAVSVIDADG
jgi:ABC-type multidrug transport system ATPase subunit